jgi:bifunctional DNase/RNase
MSGKRNASRTVTKPSLCSGIHFNRHSARTQSGTNDSTCNGSTPAANSADDTYTFASRFGSCFQRRIEGRIKTKMRSLNFKGDIFPSRYFSKKYFFAPQQGAMELFMKMIEMKVEGIGIDPQNNPLVLLRDQERSVFIPIWIGLSEAVSIQMELDERQSPRPMTHDLIAKILREMNVRLVKVTVNEVEDAVFYASLHLQFGEGDATIQQLDARPSDAIALALRADCSIFVSETVSQKMGIQVEETGPDTLRPKPRNGEEAVPGNASPDELEKFSRLLEGVDLGEGDKEGHKN